MKRLSSSSSLGLLISICPPEEKKDQQNTQGYSEEFQAMLERLNQEDVGYNTHLVLEKKRRLSLEQVKSLERNFEEENKLEPDRKVKIAEELGLQPRQVAIWFQNRRARWKTKQLERDYGVLKASYDALKADYDNLEQENEALTSKLRELKAKQCRESADSNHSVKEESLISGLDNDVSERSKTHNSSEKEGYENSKDGPSNRDSHGIVKEESQMNISLCFNGSSSSAMSLVNRAQFSNSKGVPVKAFQAQLVRTEEQSLFNTEEGYNFFSVDQAPNLHWYFSEQ